MILSATRGFYGSVSDKSIVKFDGAMVPLRKGLYSKDCYELYDENDVLYKTYGAYALCDNGYHHWPTMMNPSKDAQDEDDYNWSEMLERPEKPASTSAACTALTALVSIIATLASSKVGTVTIVVIATHLPQGDEDLL
jgi:hypothetical protein